MKTCASLLAVLALAGFAANAENFSSTGYTETIIIGSGPEACANGTLFVHHDTFENGYCWQYGGIAPPYYGAFGEAYDLGAGCVFCGAFFLTQIGYFSGNPADLYIWEGGVTSVPAAVLGMIPGHVFQSIAYWPAINQHDVDMNVCVYGEFTVGYWSDFSAETCQWYCAADVDGFAGNPWTYIAPGIGYPTGWSDPSAIWGATQSMGIGAWFGEGGSPVEAQTWGSIKGLFE